MTQHVEIISPLRDHRFVESFYDLSSTEHFWFRWRFKAFRKQANSLDIPLDANWRVLDVGAGTGILREQVETETGWDVDIADLDLSALERSKPGRGEVFYYDINEKRAELDGKYDAVFLFDVLEHIERTDSFVESLTFHLKKGGWLFANVPALQVLFGRFDEVQGHCRRYNMESLANEFSREMFDIKDMRYWGVSNVPLLFARKYLLKYFSGGKSDEEVYRMGFAPPRQLTNRLFITAMKAELTLFSKPFTGSSLLLAARKR